MLRDVTITVSNIQTPDIYYAKSYPDDDYDNNGNIEAYKVPVYKVFIDGLDKNLKAVRKEWKALRFMPYWNDPKDPYTKYKSRGWVNSGKVRVAKKAVTYYDPNYGTRNTPSPFSGAIQIDGNFLIHAGPETIAHYMWGAAGCVEIIGNFDDFKSDIKNLSGSTKASTHDALLEMVKAKRLFVEVKYALAPDLKAKFYMELK